MRRYAKITDNNWRSTVDKQEQVRRPYTVGVQDHDAGDDGYTWYTLEAVDEYDASILAIQKDDTARCGLDYEDLPMSYDEARLVLHGDRSMSMLVIEGHHMPHSPWKKIDELSPWSKVAKTRTHLTDAKSAVENLEKLIKPLQRLPGITVPGDLLSSFDSCQALLAQLELQMAEAQGDINAVCDRAEAAAAERNALTNAREARAQQARQEAERQANQQKIEDAKDDLTAQRQLARG